MGNSNCTEADPTARRCSAAAVVDLERARNHWILFDRGHAMWGRRRVGHLVLDRRQERLAARPCHSAHQHILPQDTGLAGRLRTTVGLKKAKTGKVEAISPGSGLSFPEVTIPPPQEEKKENRNNRAAERAKVHGDALWTDGSKVETKQVGGLRLPSGRRRLAPTTCNGQTRPTDREEKRQAEAVAEGVW